MSTKKIKHYEARNIADLIADKAFEHLVTPLRKKLNEMAESVYRTMFEKHNFEELRELGIMQKNNRVLITVRPVNASCDSDDVTVWLGNADDENETYLTPASWHCHSLVWRDDRVSDLMRETSEQLRPFTIRRNALQEELLRQLEGKTVTQALKAWPEAAQFITQVCGGSCVPMTIPLEQLLAKFLLMLPAPQPEGV